MRALFLMMAFTLSLVLSAAAQKSPPATGGYTLTVVVEGVNDQDGNVGLLVFNSDKGWAEDRAAALRDITVPAHRGTVNIVVPNLPAGDYALSLVHDVNKNHKLDRNWMSKPTEQWALSNNPHAVIKTPSYSACKFTLKGDQEIHVKMQQ